MSVSSVGAKTKLRLKILATKNTKQSCVRSVKAKRTSQSTTILITTISVNVMSWLSCRWRTDAGGAINAGSNIGVVLSVLRDAFNVRV